MSLVHGTAMDKPSDRDETGVGTVMRSRRSNHVRASKTGGGAVGSLHWSERSRHGAGELAPSARPRGEEELQPGPTAQPKR